MDFIAIARLGATNSAVGIVAATARAGAAWELGGKMAKANAPFILVASRVLQDATEARVTTRTLDHIQRENARLAPLAAKSKADLAAARAAFAKLEAAIHG